MRKFRAVIPPNARLEGHEVQWQGSGRVALELGCGRGLFAIQFAENHPDWRLIAIERTEKIYGLRRRLSRHPHIHNVTAIRADAALWVSQFVPDESIDHIFILYPNPYPKGRQRNLRWHNMPFFPLLLSKLKRSGRLTLATNDSNYLQEALTNADSQGLKRESLNLIEPTTKPRTHFEKKYLSRKETCWNAEFVKAENFAVSN